MEFVHYDLGRIKKDCTVEVTLQGNAANVLLMDNINFERYKNSLKQYQFVGGYTEKSPVLLKTTHAGSWHVVIDRNGRGGQIKSAVRVLAPRLPATE